MMKEYKVGKLFKEGVHSYDESLRVDIDDLGINITLILKNPSDKEIENLRTGNLKIGFLKRDTVILFLIKFGNLGWMDAPYSVHLSKNLTNLETIENNDLGYAVKTCLVDANTGILKVMRLNALKNSLSKKLKNAVMQQEEIPFDKAVYAGDINKLYKNTTKELVNLGTFF